MRPSASIRLASTVSYLLCARATRAAPASPTRATLLRPASAAAAESTDPAFSASSVAPPSLPPPSLALLPLSSFFAVFTSSPPSKTTNFGWERPHSCARLIVDSSSLRSSSRECSLPRNVSFWSAAARSLLT
eukprot:3108864-Pleurochrysis_carterae.AAC.6